VGFREILDLKVSPGEVALAWVNSYSCIIIMSPRATLIFDPVMISLEEHIRADAIIITHEHSDHFAPELAQSLQKKTGALVLTTAFVAQRLSGARTKILNVGDSFAVKDFELHAEPCKHSANQPLSFVISTEGGITIYHPGDSEAFPEMASFRERYKPDILLYSGTSLENAAQIAKLVKPQVVVSYHTDVESQKRFAALLRRESPGTRAEMIRRLETYLYLN
jgi:L-ascorbate metabolism protein UlaG (beta-lactamase superfamily)